MKRLVLSLLLLSTVLAPSVHAEVVTDPVSSGTTVSEQAAEECEEEDVLDEFGHGSFSRCYGVVVWELADQRGLELVRFEDGSGLLLDGTGLTFGPGTYPPAPR